MRARAPGKLVISGAYAVLRGAPALVTAVDRYVTADDNVTSEFKTPEVAAALSLLKSNLPHPSFSATELREQDRKLGLGSSAAICAASVALLYRRLEPQHSELTDEVISQQLYPLTLQAHQTAQGGGSGIDVAAACFGGHLRAQLQAHDGKDTLSLVPVQLPKELVIETWSSPVAASTAQFVRNVFALEHSDFQLFSKLFLAQVEASKWAAAAIAQQNVPDFIAALKAQYFALRDLGDAASVPIVLPDLRPLAASLGENECFIPSGAGGGDVSLYISDRPSSEIFRSLAAKSHLKLIPLGLGARGVHLLKN